MLARHIILRNAAVPEDTAPAGKRRRRSATPRSSEAAPRPSLETADLSPGDLQSLAQEPDVVCLAPVMPTCMIAPLASTAATETGDSWGIAAVGADVSTYTGEGVTVAVLDTGIDADHAAFKGMTIERQDFTGTGDVDVVGHGTHCAGTIFGRDVEGRRIGVARGVQRALVGKVLKFDGHGDTNMIIRAIQWAADQGADVISMSLGFDFPTMVGLATGQGWPVELATSKALEGYRANVRMFDALMVMIGERKKVPVLVAAAGNESRKDGTKEFKIAASVPAAAKGVISVGAVGRTPNGFDIASFSNTLPQISAPGVDVVSADRGGGLVAQSGTSMACPHVAGVAALWWQAVRGMNLPSSLQAGRVVAQLQTTARTSGFAASVDAADRGLGLVTAP
jgi:subtilisin family serine protease